MADEENGFKVVSPEQLAEKLSFLIPAIRRAIGDHLGITIILRDNDGLFCMGTDNFRAVADALIALDEKEKLTVRSIVTVGEKSTKH